MFDQRHSDLEQAQALERVREWIRARFGLGQDNAILVAELNCGVQGCPPLETAPSDLAWLIGDLDDQETNYWDCC